MPGWPNGATFSHVWSFGRLDPLLDTPLEFPWFHFEPTYANGRPDP